MLNDSNLHSMFMDEMLPKWLKTLSNLWVAFGKTPTAEQLELYQENLADIPFGLLELAVKRAIRDHKYSNVPTVHDVWEALRKELGNPHDVKIAMSQWEENRWNQCVIKFDRVENLEVM